MNASSTPPINLKGQDFLLRRAQENDVEARLALGRDPEIYRMFGGDAFVTRPYTQADAEAWLRANIEHPAAWIIDRDGLIGEVRLDNIDRHDRRASFAIGILDRNCWAKGLALPLRSLYWATHSVHSPSTGFRCAFLLSTSVPLPATANAAFRLRGASGRRRWSMANGTMTS